MGLFDWIRPRPATEVIRLQGNHAFESNVVGEMTYQTNLEAICGPRCEDGEDRLVEATLILEDSNPHDSNAVRVDIQGRTVGYLSRSHAVFYRDRLREHGHPRATVICEARIVGGWDRRGNRGNYGVTLDLEAER